MFTRRLAGGCVYGERVVTFRGVTYREWSPWRSKLAASIKKGLRELPLQSDSRVLYLGAASGTTASHVSDLCPQGRVFCVEISLRSFRDLLTVCRDRPNMFPLNADARRPEGYGAVVGEADVIYQDIAQRDQVGVFLANARPLLRAGGAGLLMLKARSVSSTEGAEGVLRSMVQALEREGAVKIIERIRLEPFHKDHLALSVRWRG